VRTSRRVFYKHPQHIRSHIILFLKRPNFVSVCNDTAKHVTRHTRVYYCHVMVAGISTRPEKRPLFSESWVKRSHIWEMCVHVVTQTFCGKILCSTHVMHSIEQVHRYSNPASLRDPYCFPPFVWFIDQMLRADTTYIATLWTHCWVLGRHVRVKTTFLQSDACWLMPTIHSVRISYTAARRSAIYITQDGRGCHDTSCHDTGTVKTGWMCPSMAVSSSRLVSILWVFERRLTCL